MEAVVESNPSGGWMIVIHGEGIGPNAQAYFSETEMNYAIEFASGWNAGHAYLARKMREGLNRMEKIVNG